MISKQTPTYHLCFCFNNLYPSGRALETIDDSSRFKIQFFQDSNFIAKTGPSEMSTHSRIGFDKKKDMISLKCSDSVAKTNSFAEIRLIQRDYNSGQALIGCYNFSIHHHISAYRQLNKNTFKMSVDFPSQYRLQYEVLIQTSKQAFELLKKEHLLSKSLDEITVANSQVDGLLPEDHEVIQKRQYPKAVRVNGQNISIKARYWTPQKKRKDTEYAQQKIQSSLTIRQRKQSVLIEEDKNKTSKKIYKRLNSLSQTDQKYKQTEETEPFVEESQYMSVSPSSEERKYRKIEQQLKKDAVIIVPSQGNDYWAYKQIVDTEEIANIPKKQGYVVANEISDRKGMFKKIILAFIFIIVIGLGVGVMVKNIRKHRTGASLRNKH